MKEYVKPVITYIELRVEERISGSMCKVKPKSSSEPSVLSELNLDTTSFFS